MRLSCADNRRILPPIPHHDGADNEGSKMFKLTEKAKAFNKFIIQHTVCGDYDLTSDYSSIEEAIKYEAQGADCSEEEMALTIREYKQEEVIEAAEDGFGWPVRLGLVEEVDDEEENLENIDESLLKACVRAVDENNRVNAAEWRDWLDGQDIIQQYAPDSWCDEVCWVLDRSVESNGESLKVDLSMIERQIKGQNFSGSFFDRK